MVENYWDGVGVENSLRRGLFHLVHNTDDGTISLISVARNAYVRSSPYINFKSGEIAKFELRKSKYASAKGALMLLPNMKFLKEIMNSICRSDNEDEATLFEFVPVQE